MLADNDRIFANLYEFQPRNLDADQSRGDGRCQPRLSGGVGMTDNNNNMADRKRRKLWAISLLFAGVVLAFGLGLTGVALWENHPRLVDKVAGTGRLVAALAIMIGSIGNWRRLRRAR